MPISATRYIKADAVRNLGVVRNDFEIADLTRIQTESYARFLQLDAVRASAKSQGLEEILREIFPIESYDGQHRLEYLRYELGKPRYTPTECRQLRLTYGRPFRVWLRLVKEQPIEEEVYLGDMPIMLGGGEFIINGAERVVVSQLHRSPGVDFVLSSEPGERKNYSCRIIPERGSWIELVVSKKETLGVRIDQSGKFSAMTLLRAMSPEYSTDAALIRLFYETAKVKVSKGDHTEIRGQDLGRRRRLSGQGRARRRNHRRMRPCDHRGAGNRDGRGGNQVDRNRSPSSAIRWSSTASWKIAPATKPRPRRSRRATRRRSCESISGCGPAIRRSSKRRPTCSTRSSSTSTAIGLGRVGRFRINRKFAQDIPDSEMTLAAEDFVNAIRYLVRLRGDDQDAQVDDIDNLGNRRLRTIDELASDEIRKGFLKLRRTVQERMSLKDVEEMSPRTLINPKSVSAAIEYFFGRSELSQVVDQTNPLSMLTHERRFERLGPGGLNRKRAGFEVRDVHISHYGRICPIETPEGTNIGLISSLSIFAKVDDYGFLDHALPQGRERQAHRRDRMAAGRRRIVRLRRSGRHADRKGEDRGGARPGPLPQRRALGRRQRGEVHRRCPLPDGRRFGRPDSRSSSTTTPTAP